MQSGDGNGGAQRRHVERHQRALAQLVAHAAFGHQGEAEARLRQPLLCRQAVDQSHVGIVETGTDKLPCQQVPRGIAVARRRWKADPALARQVLGTQATATGQAMVARRDHPHRLAAGAELHEVGAVAGEVAQAERGFAAAHQVGDLGARRGAQLEPHLAGAAREAAQAVDDSRVGQGADQGERDRAAGAGLQIAHRIVAVLEGGQRRLGMGQEGAAGLGQAGAAAHALEQRGAELVLELVDAAADRRLRAVQPLPGAREAAGLGNGEEGADLVDVHGSGILMLMAETMHFPKHRVPARVAP